MPSASRNLCFRCGKRRVARTSKSRCEECLAYARADQARREGYVPGRARGRPSKIAPRPTDPDKLREWLGLPPPRTDGLRVVVRESRREPFAWDVLLVGPRGRIIKRLVEDASYNTALNVQAVCEGKLNRGEEV